MPAALLVRFRPTGPWRFGPDNGAKDRTGRVLHSDVLYSALTLAMKDLGWLEEWIAATAESAEPSLRFTSGYPYVGRMLLVQPPLHVWPPAGVHSGRLRWKSARFVPVSLVPALLRDEPLNEDEWAVDPVSECLLPVAKHGALQAPFRVMRRRFAAVDRVTGVSEEARELAALQFAPGAGIWFAATFGSDTVRATWFDRLRAACRLLADTGIGGGRSLGWGRSLDPRVEAPADLGRMLTGAMSDGADGNPAWWLLSLFSPAESDSVDWARGNYALSLRSGRTESLANWGELKPTSRMVGEGSVLLSGAPLAGTARNVATAEIPHPVYRSGIALAVSVPWKEHRRLPWEEATTAAPAPAVAEEELPAESAEAEALPVSEPAVEEETAAEAPQVKQTPAEETPAEEGAASEEHETAAAENAEAEALPVSESALEEPDTAEASRVEQAPAAETPAEEAAASEQQDVSGNEGKPEEEEGK